jgi:hypothetical protein
MGELRLPRWEEPQTYGLSVKIPPITGPKTDDTPKAIPKKDVNTGRLWSGTSPTVIMMAPQLIPRNSQPLMHSLMTQ